MTIVPDPTCGKPASFPEPGATPPDIVTVRGADRTTAKRFQLQRDSNRDCCVVGRMTDASHAALTLRAGRKLRLRADVSVTPAGLLSIGAIVSAILLSSAAIVVAARR